MENAIIDPRTASCPDCAIGPFARNYYFDGKFMVARDFWDEQRYHVDKLRHHHQRLHGTGIVCGLEVVRHDVPECRDRYVCIQPGTAIDCCGHEIVVREETVVDLWQLDALAALRDEPDGKDHVVQLCLRYKECPTEEVPVLYDDCGCDDTACLPNRILESFEVDAIIDPVLTGRSPGSPGLSWGATFGVPHAARVAMAGGSIAPQTLYVLTADAPGRVVPVTTATGAPGVPRLLDRAGLALAVSDDGSRVYAIVKGASAAKDHHLVVLDGSDLVLPAINDIVVPGSHGQTVVDLAIAPGGRLGLLLGDSGQLVLFDTAVDTNDPTLVAPASRSIGATGLSGLAISGGRAYTAHAAGGDLAWIDLISGVTGTVAVAPGLAPAAHPVALALVESTAPDALVVVDDAPGAPRIHLVGPATGTLAGTIPLAHPPVAATPGGGGNWAYVVERDGGTSYLEPVNLYALAGGASAAPSTPLAIGDPAGSAVLAAAGSRIYVPFVGDPALPDRGGVAVVEITDVSCGDLGSACPTCDGPDCLVLATIEHYRPGDRLDRQIQPVADPVADRNDGVARIDERDRRRLPSVQALAEMVECLLENGPSGAGQQGPPGRDGADGLPGQDGQDGENGHNGLNGSNGVDGVDGADGEGLEWDLTRIEALSWKHAQGGRLVKVYELDGKTESGIVIGFSREVDTTTIEDVHVFQVLVELDEEGDLRRGVRCRCAAVGRIVPVEFVTSSDPELIDYAKEVGPDAPGVAFIPAEPILGAIWKGLIRDLWVVLRGDFVVDLDGRAIDADFVRADLPTGDGPIGSRFGVQGGLFESWFVPDLERDDRIDPNLTNRIDLMRVHGIGAATADRIIAERETAPFTDIEDFRDRTGLTRPVWEAIRDTIRFEE